MSDLGLLHDLFDRFFGACDPDENEKPRSKYRIVRHLLSNGLTSYDVEERHIAKYDPATDLWIPRFTGLASEAEAFKMLDKLKEFNRGKNIQEFQD